MRLFDQLRLVTFDVVGTLIRFKEPPVAMYVQTASKYDIKVDYEQVQSSFYSQWKTMDAHSPHFGSTSGISSQRWWIDLVKNTFKDALNDKYDENKMNSIARSLYDYYKTPEPYIVSEESFDTLKQIHSQPVDRRCCVGIISNFDNRLHDVIPALDLDVYIDFICTSEDACSSKPDAAIFEFATQQSRLKNLAPNQILHVGDDVNKDYFGAKNVGWNALLVDRLGFHHHHSMIEPNDIIEDLTQIFTR